MFRSLALSLTAICFGLGQSTAETVAEANTCGPTELVVYFSPESGSLSDAAVAVIDNAADGLAGCQILGAELTILSSDAGANPALPAARRAAVLARFAEAGLRMTVTEVTAASSGRPGFEIPMARRVSMTIDAVPAITS